MVCMYAWSTHRTSRRRASRRQANPTPHPHQAAVKHLDAMLGRAGVPHVTIVKGDQHAHLESAVETWSTKPSCRVFLLHAGAAAAGLTLVAAQHVFLMEPFSTPGQELQALNRCHRIGQTRPVTCTTYYCERTVEERLLAFRALEHAQFADGDDDGEAVSLLGVPVGGLPECLEVA